VARDAEAELRALWVHYEDGIVRENYSPGTPGGIHVLEAQSVGEAERRVSEFPPIPGGVMRPEIIEPRPFSALSTLFSRT
jgi:hypothetical protein